MQKFVIRGKFRKKTGLLRDETFLAIGNYLAERGSSVPADRFADPGLDLQPLIYQRSEPDGRQVSGKSRPEIERNVLTRTEHFHVIER